MGVKATDVVKVTLRAPAGFESSHIDTLSGRTYHVKDRHVEMSIDDAKAQEAQGWTPKEFADA